MKNIPLYLGLLLVCLATACLNKNDKKEEGNTSGEAQLQYEEDWQSLKNYTVPEWFKDAKLGIFIHWGPYSVPAFGSEWYGRNMYMDTATFTAQLELQSKGPNPVFVHHNETWGDPKEFGYKDFIPMFKGENFDADEWISLFKKAGAKYVVPVAEHHDGFAMYHSKVTRWNAVDMGPKKDILKALMDAGKRHGMKVGASSHFAFNWAFFNKKPHFDTVDPDYADFYGKKGLDPKAEVNEEFKQLWWKRTIDIIDNYQPDILWFDFYWDRDAFKDFHPKLAAYYYNKGMDWEKEVVLQDKNFRYESFPAGTFVHDLERGLMSDIRKNPWQTDTSIGENSWGYVVDWISKDPNAIIDDLIDITSKNGCLLLNVGPKADGTIPEDQKEILLEIGNWLSVNGDAIYGTRYWKQFGEGPTEVAEGYMSEHKGERAFGAEDIRFTTKGDKLYAIALDWPENGVLHIKSLRKGEKEIGALKLLGYDNEISWSQEADALQINMPDEKTGNYAWVFEIEN